MMNLQYEISDIDADFDVTPKLLANRAFSDKKTARYTPSRIITLPPALEHQCGRNCAWKAPRRRLECGVCASHVLAMPFAYCHFNWA
eukprot:852486-Rhodomonas_salina.1